MRLQAFVKRETGSRASVALEFLELRRGQSRKHRFARLAVHPHSVQIECIETLAKIEASSQSLRVLHGWLGDPREIQELNVPELIRAHLTEELLDSLLVCTVREFLGADQLVEVVRTVRPLAGLRSRRT